MSWQWIINQIFAFLGLIFVVISFQQKDSKRLLIFRNIATIFVFIGLCFLGNVSAVIFCGVGAVRNLIALYFAFKPNTKRIVKFSLSCMLVISLVVLNILYWKNYMNLYSIFLGTIAVVTFMQSKAAVIRKLSVVMETFSIIYYSLLLSPTNVIIEVIGLTSAIIGIVRLDLKKKLKKKQ